MPIFVQALQKQVLFSAALPNHVWLASLFDCSIIRKSISPRHFISTSSPLQVQVPRAHELRCHQGAAHSHLVGQGQWVRGKSWCQATKRCDAQQVFFLNLLFWVRTPDSKPPEREIQHLEKDDEEAPSLANE